jgi:hypothetical protein
MSIKPVALFGGTRSNDSEIWARRLKDWELPARDTELYAIPDTHRVVSVDDLKALEDTLDFWINSADTRSMSEQEYKTWLALGHQSKTARRLRAIIEDKP